ncbi:MAG: glycogen synthase GlgA [Myxococcaceae bacterium]
MKVLYVASEVAPYSKSGGLGDVAHALPRALSARGHEVRVVTPLYASARIPNAEDSGRSIRLRFPFGEQRAVLRVARSAPRHEVWFLDHPGFYGRSGIYGDASGEYGDNHRRFAFLAVGALAAAQAMHFAPDVVHLNDWQTGLAALALARGFRGTSLGEARSLFTIHNLAYQGLFPKAVMTDLGLPWDVFNEHGLEFYDQVNFMKAGLAFADALSTVSPTYAQEIQTEAYGCMLEGTLRARAHELHGILNGIDVHEWDPRADPHLPAPYDGDDLSGKAICKAELRHRLGLPQPEVLSDAPLFGVVTRLAAQKGISLLLAALPALLDDGAEAVVLGSGDGWYEDALRALAASRPDRFRAFIGFDPALSHLVEGGSDFFLMPSLYEPCGLNQMYSLRYGTVPVVRATGGLEDTVRDADLPDGTGFKFSHFDPSGLLWAGGRALEWWWQRRDALDAMRRRGMRQDWSWESSAQAYERLYASLAD